MSWDPQPSDVSEDLTAAAMWGNLKLLESLLENGADPNPPNSQGNSALHVACYYGETECASVLLHHKAKVNAPGADGKTPLHRAVTGVCVQEPGAKFPTEERIQENQMDIVRLLVSHGADLDATDKSGASARDLALECDFYECVDLLEELHELQCRDAKKRLRESRLQGLYEACRTGDLKAVQELIQCVPKAINEFHFGEENPLMCAAAGGHLDIVEYLLDNGAVAVASPQTNYTALHVAAQIGNSEIVISLLNRLPALLALDDLPKETSLHIAAREGHTEVVRNLLAVAARAEQLKTPDQSYEEEPSTFTSENRKIEMNSSLGEICIDVMTPSFQDQRTPLHESAMNNHVDVVRLLVDFLREYRGRCTPSKVDLARVDSHFPGFSPQRHSGVPLGPPSRKANAVPGIDAMTMRGKTAFHEAARLGYFEVMVVLLQSGADINSYMRPMLDENINTDLTALLQACLMNRIDIVRFLLQHGATDARLKALKRTLRVPYDSVAGLLLCYNGGVQVVSADEPRQSRRHSKPKPKDPNAPSVLVNVAWNSKNLPYIRKEWLGLATVELLKSKDSTCAISQLDISSNQLTELPIAIFQLPYLTQLEAGRNKLKSLPFLADEPNDGGWSCHKLQSVDFNSNELATLPFPLFILQELKEIYANENKLTELPVAMWNAPKLQKLSVNRNLLERLPIPVDWEPDGSPIALSSLAESQVGLTENLVSTPNTGDSGYMDSEPPGLEPHGLRGFRYGLGEVSDESFEKRRRKSMPLFPFEKRHGSTMTRPMTIARTKSAAPEQSFCSRIYENFYDTNIKVDEIEDIETDGGTEEDGVTFPLEVLDVSRNRLLSVPPGLSCLAPKLQKLNVSFNKVKVLGQVSDYPLDLEFLDACNNEIHSAINPALSHSDIRFYQPCSQKQLGASLLSTCTTEASTTSSPFQYKPCSHRMHRNLRKLTTLKLNHNQLVDIQLFRLVSRQRSTDLTASFEESVVKHRANTASDPFAMVLSPTSKQQPSKEDLASKSATVGRMSSLKRGRVRMSDLVDTQRSAGSSSSNSSPSNSSREGSSSSEQPAHPMIISPLFPQLSTLEVAHNHLKAVPAHLQLITNLSCLVLNHNLDIDTLPLELSNLDHLWNLEYEGCPLTNPPAGDLDKFRLAADKLMYMRSLLHDAKPNESMKLMLVGLQKMGKTTLLSRMREMNESNTPQTQHFTQRVGDAPMAASMRASSGKKGKGEPLSTVGVDLGIWKYRKDLEPEYQKTRRKGAKPLRSVTFYTWDFGGQEEYYVTHQCFLSTRSLYLMVWNVTDGEKGIVELGPWLHNIQARAPGSPVVIVGTHCDRLKGDGERERRKLELNNIIYERYLVGRGPQQLRELGLPKILDVIYVGCPATGRVEGVSELRMALYDIAFSLNVPKAGGHNVSKTKLLEQPIPASFLLLEETVRQLSVECKQEDQPPVLKENVFRERTKSIVANPRELNQAVTFLHENGIMLHYATPALNHLYFVDPQWLCDMLAHVVTVPEVNRFIQRCNGPDAGILHTSVLAQVFRGKHFPQAQRREYIELLGKFEVALILDRNRLLVPSMLPAMPNYTIHHFVNVFPRPSLSQILARLPNTAKLFSRSANSSPKSTPSPVKERRRLGGGGGEEGEEQNGVAGHVSEELCRTGLILRRFYFMTYVPSGFWPRLISRFITAPNFASIILTTLGLPPEQINEISKQLISGQTSGAVSLEWSYWRTGIELWYKGLSLLRIAEILPQGTFRDCKPSPSIFEQWRTDPIDPAFDTDDLSFELNSQWIPVDMSPTRGIEIIVPDTVCPALLRKEFSLARDKPTGSVADLEKGKALRHESSWMSAQLLSISVDYIDSLLEDWYPGLGAREGNKTIESIPYVNRVIPCPFCVTGAKKIDPNMHETEQGHDVHDQGTPRAGSFSQTPTAASTPLVHQLSSPSSTPSASPLVRQSSNLYLPPEPQPLSNGENKGSRSDLDGPPFGSVVLPKDNASYRLRSNDVFSSSSSPVIGRRSAKRALFPMASSDNITVPVHLSPDLNDSRDGLDPQEIHRCSSLPENCKLSILQPDNVPETVFQRKGSLADLNRAKKQVSPAPMHGALLASPLDDLSKELCDPEDEMQLTQATKFGFMIESVILTSRQTENIFCPAHPDQPLPIRDLAPDLVFADLLSHFILDPVCVDKGEYIDHGSFGDIYHGSVYPTRTATDDEGREVAIKIDRMDSKKYSTEMATKAYVEVRTEVAILNTMNHPHVIEFVGVVLQPLCFILEWAPRGSLHSILQKYRKVDARVGPLTLQQTAYQVASGLAYLHEHKIVYYDLKSPNVLVFQFPTPQDSLRATTTTLSYDHEPPEEGMVYVKIADLGISRRMSPGGVMGFKGSPGFMAPEILKYVGTEACTEKVDIFSFGMFLYELISLYFPFEKQNLMSSQIEKLIIEGERPPLQNRELNNPILYLDTMRWCWQQDYRLRPSAHQLMDVLSNSSLSQLVDAISLHTTVEVTCACICTLPIEKIAPELLTASEEDPRSFATSMSAAPHTHVTRGDLQEELWLCLYTSEESGGLQSSKICIINFRGKASLPTQSISVCPAKITSICAVNDTMWVGTEEGQVFIYDAVSRVLIEDRHLAVLPCQGITSINHIQAHYQVLVTRRDGCSLLFDEMVLEHKLPDDSRYDKRINSTKLPVRAVFKSPEKLPILCAHVLSFPGEDKKLLCCGTKLDMLLFFDIYPSRIEYCRKLYNRKRYDCSEEDQITHVAEMRGGGGVWLWALSSPGRTLYCWDAKSEKLIQTVKCDQFTTDPVTAVCTMGHQLQLSLTTGKILVLNTSEDASVSSSVELQGHVKDIYTILPIGTRTLPRHWLPNIIGRSNVIDYYRDLIAEEDVQDISTSMVGRQSRILVSIGYGFSGIAGGRFVEPLMSPKDQDENFILLWSLSR